MASNLPTRCTELENSNFLSYIIHIRFYDGILLTALASLGCAGVCRRAASRWRRAALLWATSRVGRSVADSWAGCLPWLAQSSCSCALWCSCGAHRWSASSLCLVGAPSPRLTRTFPLAARRRRSRMARIRWHVVEGVRVFGRWLVLRLPYACPMSAL